MNDKSISSIINKMNVSKRDDGRYEGRITVNDKRKSFYGKNKSEVKNKAKEYLQQVANGYKEPTKIKVSEYVEYWLVKYKYRTIEPSSYTRLYNTYNNQIKPYLGNLYIGDLTTSRIQELINEFANPKKGVKPLAMSGLKKIIQLLRPCLNMAVKEGVIQKNPCDDVIMPSESYVQVKTKEQFSLSDDELEEFKKAALATYKTTGEYRSRDALVLLITVSLGLRAGEIIALEWDDINLKDQIVTINKTIQTNVSLDEMNERKADLIKASAKTKAGKRILKLNDSAVYYINELKAYDARNKIISKYVCCCNNGNRQRPRNLQRSLDRLVDHSELSKHITLHTLRHTFGSTLLRKGVSIEVVSKLLGHSNITITYQKYIHVLQEQQAKAMLMVNVC